MALALILEWLPLPTRKCGFLYDFHIATKKANFLYRMQSKMLTAFLLDTRARWNLPQILHIACRTRILVRHDARFPKKPYE
jgi:hypothetical protein